MVLGFYPANTHKLHSHPPKQSKGFHCCKMASKLKIKKMAFSSLTGIQPGNCCSVNIRAFLVSNTKFWEEPLLGSRFGPIQKIRKISGKKRGQQRVDPKGPKTPDSAKRRCPKLFLSGWNQSRISGKFWRKYSQ